MMTTMTELMERAQALVAERRRQRASEDAARELHQHLSIEGVKNRLEMMDWPPELVERASIRIDLLFAYVELAVNEQGIRGIDIQMARETTESYEWLPYRSFIEGELEQSIHTYRVVTDYEYNDLTGEISPCRWEHTEFLVNALALALEANASWDAAVKEMGRRNAQHDYCSFHSITIEQLPADWPLCEE